MMNLLGMVYCEKFYHNSNRSGKWFVGKNWKIILAKNDESWPKTGDFSPFARTFPQKVRHFFSFKPPWDTISCSSGFSRGRGAVFYPPASSKACQRFFSTQQAGGRGPAGQPAASPQRGIFPPAPPAGVWRIFFPERALRCCQKVLEHLWRHGLPVQGTEAGGMEPVVEAAALIDSALFPDEQVKIVFVRETGLLGVPLQNSSGARSAVQTLPFPEPQRSERLGDLPEEGFALFLGPARKSSLPFPGKDKARYSAATASRAGEASSSQRGQQQLLPQSGSQRRRLPPLPSCPHCPLMRVNAVEAKPGATSTQWGLFPSRSTTNAVCSVQGR